MVLLLVITNFPYLKYEQQNILQISVLEVGQGDSILIRSADGKYLLVDGGPDASVLSRLGQILPVWIREIDYLVITHPDLDHLGGAVEVLARYKIKNLIISDHKSSSQAYAFLEKLMSNVKSTTKFAGESIVLGCCTVLDFLWPDNSIDRAKLSANDNSLVFQLRYNDFDMLFTGDIEEKIEAEILVSDIDVLKIAHHGSKTSTSNKLLESTNPEIAIISAGKNNKFNHPHPEVLQRLQDSGIDVYRTDQNNTVHIYSDGKKYWFKH